MVSGAVTSSAWRASPGAYELATLITGGIEPGDPVINGTSPELPALATTIMPAAMAFSIAMAYVSPLPPPENVDPRDMLMTSSASLMSPSSLGSTAHSMASGTMLVLPCAPKTFKAHRRAPGATPCEMFSVPRPATMPATCVPWNPSSMGSGSG